MSVVLVGIVLVGALNIVGTARVGQRQLDNRRRGHQLAQDLMSEILQHRYADPEGSIWLWYEYQNEMDKAGVLTKYMQGISATMGPDAYDGFTTNRSPFDDIDDYHGWSASPPQHRDGTVMSGLPGWRRAVVVEPLKPDRMEVSDKDHGRKRVTVTVSLDDVPVAELVTLRSYSMPWQEACCLPDGACVPMWADSCSALGGTPQGFGNGCFDTGCPSVSSGFLSYWKFDEGAGSTAADSVSNNHGSVVNAAWTAGLVDGSLAFDGSTSYVDCGNRENLSITTQITIILWVWPDEIKEALLVDKNYRQSYYFSQKANGAIAFGTSTEGAFWEAVSDKDKVKADGKWYQVAATYDSITGKCFLYRNGAKIKEVSDLGAIGTSVDPLTVGAATEGSRYFHGKIDDVRIYDTALTGNEIHDLYDEQKP
jgi:hypothetical protein